MGLRRRVNKNEGVASRFKIGGILDKLVSLLYTVTIMTHNTQVDMIKVFILIEDIEFENACVEIAKREHEKQVALQNRANCEVANAPDSHKI